jgi:hypothetical protein
MKIHGNNRKKIHRGRVHARARQHGNTQASTRAEHTEKNTHEGADQGGREDLVYI